MLFVKGQAHRGTGEKRGTRSRNIRDTAAYCVYYIQQGSECKCVVFLLTVEQACCDANGKK